MNLHFGHVFGRAGLSVHLPRGLAHPSSTRKTRDVDPMPLQCWISFCDDGLTLQQHRVNASCLLGILTVYTQLDHRVIFLWSSCDIRVITVWPTCGSSCDYSHVWSPYHHRVIIVLLSLHVIVSLPVFITSFISSYTRLIPIFILYLPYFINQFKMYLIHLEQIPDLHFTIPISSVVESQKAVA